MASCFTTEAPKAAAAAGTGPTRARRSSNSNLISHLFRAHVAPNDAIGTGLMFFQFSLDQPASLAEGVTAKDLAFEINGYMDWKMNKNFTTSLVAAYADPGKAVQQAFDRTKNFTSGMVYLAYSF